VGSEGEKGKAGLIHAIRLEQENAVKARYRQATEAVEDPD